MPVPAALRPYHAPSKKHRASLSCFIFGISYFLSFYNFSLTLFYKTININTSQESLRNNACREPETV